MTPARQPYPQRCNHECVCGTYQATAMVYKSPCPAGNDIYELCEHDTRPHTSTPAPAAMISGRSLSNEKEYVIRESQLKHIQDMIFHEDEEKFLKLSWKILSNPAISSDCPHHNELSCMMTPEGHDAQVAKAEREKVLDAAIKKLDLLEYARDPCVGAVVQFAAVIEILESLRAQQEKQGNQSINSAENNIRMRQAPRNR